MFSHSVLKIRDYHAAIPDCTYVVSRHTSVLYMPLKAGAKCQEKINIYFVEEFSYTFNKTKKKVSAK